VASKLALVPFVFVLAVSGCGGSRAGGQGGESTATTAASRHVNPRKAIFLAA
jgi:hypothetical protein